MTSDELLRVATDYQTLYVEADVNSDVRFGCDCGCGGDYYESNPGEWEDMVTESNEAYDAFKELCTRLGVAFND